MGIPAGLKTILNIHQMGNSARTRAIMPKIQAITLPKLVWMRILRVPMLTLMCYPCAGQ